MYIEGGQVLALAVLDQVVRVGLIIGEDDVDLRVVFVVDDRVKLDCPVVGIALRRNEEGRVSSREHARQHLAQVHVLHAVGVGRSVTARETGKCCKVNSFAVRSSWKSIDTIT